MIAFIADIHLGTKLSQMDYLKSLNKFLDIIKKHKEPCHAIIVLGDLFDHRLSIDEAKFASMFISNIVCNYCGRDRNIHVPVKFIHGTYTHDYDQYGIYLSILNKIPDVDIFYTNTVCSDSLSNGMRILYLPQEYGDIDYSEAFNSEYDIIVGHGPMSSQTSQPCKSTQYEILHSVEQLGSISKICVFGHYHNYTDFGNNVYYAGSMLRWMYGEDVEKRFFICNDNFEVETIPNEFALKYETITVDSPESLRSELSKEIDNPHRFIITPNNDSELVEYNAIMNAYKKNPNLKYRINQSTMNNNDDVDNKKIDTLLNPSNVIIEPIPALLSYIKDKYDTDVTDEIHDYENKINRNNEKENVI